MPNHLLALRLHHGYSQQQLADALGVTKLTVGRWERGEMLPRPFYLARLCQVFACQPHDLGFAPQPATLAAIAASHEGAAPAARYDPAIPTAPPVPLVGREEVLARITARLCQPQPRGGFTALNGLPGVGKTSLAIALAYDPALRACIPDGILWASLGPQPPLFTLLARWGGLVGLSELQLAAADEAQKRQALVAALGRRAMLLVLDDVWRLDDALALWVGGPHCAYLLTTRFPAIAAQLAVDGAMRIEELAEEQSLDLLQRLAPAAVEREAEKTRQLIRAVGGLPLALVLVGQYLRKYA